uniref:Uncharacterized protein n=1 Tax=Trypanosoma vivax (strain Y486) TaxID=1055687 RepID=G0UC39_TRYVY|nr:hypothetical protein, conserved in T. vivax [Trypanosoma vivax Y486]
MASRLHGHASACLLRRTPQSASLAQGRARRYPAPWASDAFLRHEQVSILVHQVWGRMASLA